MLESFIRNLKSINKNKLFVSSAKMSWRSRGKDNEDMVNQLKGELFIIFYALQHDYSTLYIYV